MTFISVDASEVHTLTIELETAPERLRDNCDEVFKNEASALQRDMKRDATGHRHLREFQRALTGQKIGPLHHVVGFNVGRQGSLAQIVLFGTATNAPIYDFYAPLIRRTPYFVEHLARIAEDSVFTGPGSR